MVQTKNNELKENLRHDKKRNERKLAENNHSIIDMRVVRKSSILRLQLVWAVSSPIEEADIVKLKFSNSKGAFMVRRLKNNPGTLVVVTRNSDIFTAASFRFHAWLEKKGYTRNGVVNIERFLEDEHLISNYKGSIKGMDLWNRMFIKFINEVKKQDQKSKQDIFMKAEENLIQTLVQNNFIAINAKGEYERVGDQGVAFFVQKPSKLAVRHELIHTIDYSNVNFWRKANALRKKLEGGRLEKYLREFLSQREYRSKREDVFRKEIIAFAGANYKELLAWGQSNITQKNVKKELQQFVRDVRKLVEEYLGKMSSSGGVAQQIISPNQQRTKLDPMVLLKLLLMPKSVR